MRGTILVVEDDPAILLGLKEKLTLEGYEVVEAADGEEARDRLAARRPDLVVLAATLPENLEPHAAQLTALAQNAPLALAGAGATPQIAAAVGARLLAGDPVTEAENIQWPR